MAKSQNPLSSFYRAPKSYTGLPSQGKYYTDDVVEMPDNGELPIYPMTAKDEMIMKNPDALLNGEAVAQVIASCIPNIKQPRQMISNDVDALLIAVQGATYGDQITVTGACPKCGHENEATASVESALDEMTTLKDVYKVKTHNGLTLTLRPFTYDSTVKAGIANFKSTRSLQSLANVEDEMEQLRTFNENFLQIAALNFEVIVDSVAKVSGTDDEGEEFVVTDPASIREFLENADATIGKQVESEIANIAKIGVNKQVKMQCEDCENVFEKDIGFDPVNFSTAS